MLSPSWPYLAIVVCFAEKSFLRSVDYSSCTTRSEWVHGALGDKSNLLL